MSEPDSPPADLTKKQAYLVTLAAGLGWMFDSVIINMFTVALPQLEEAFKLTALSIGVISSLFLFGYALGTLGGGTLADYVGRRLSLGISIMLYTLFSGLTAFASGVGTLALFRFFTGVGAGTELPVGAAYVAEVAPPARRGLWIGMMNAVFSLGIFIAAAALFILGNWRWAFLSTVVMGALILLVRWRAEESPAFLRLRQNIKDGRIVRTRPTFADVFSPRYRARTLRIMLLWLGYWIFWWSWSIFVPKYLGSRFGVPHASILTVMMCYACGSFLMQIFAGWLSDRIGRRSAITILSILAIAAIWVWVYGPDDGRGIVLGGVAFMCALGPVGVLLVYTTEVFPTALRGTGQSMTIGIARLISVAAPSAAGLLTQRFGVETEFCVVSAFLLISVASVLLGSETRGSVLDDHDPEHLAETTKFPTIGARQAEACGPVGVN
jgi:MFS transporter, putative metabolite:H+ symporter